MNEYVIKVEEILRKSFIVKADTLDAAIEKIETLYRDENEIVLDYGDYADNDVCEADTPLELAKELEYEVIE